MNEANSNQGLRLPIFKPLCSSRVTFWFLNSFYLFVEMGNTGVDDYEAEKIVPFVINLKFTNWLLTFDITCRFSVSHAIVLGMDSGIGGWLLLLMRWWATQVSQVFRLSWSVMVPNEEVSDNCAGSVRLIPLAMWCKSPSMPKIHADTHQVLVRVLRSNSKLEVRKLDMAKRLCSYLSWNGQGDSSLLYWCCGFFQMGLLHLSAASGIFPDVRWMAMMLDLKFGICLWCASLGKIFGHFCWWKSCL